jgi:phosphatidylserine/phosphatidylglycerophosphate/cardiolipin synthase-like enzyme
MALVAMNWKQGRPPNDFVGFAIEYKEPGGDKFFSLPNRLAFPGPAGALDPNRKSSLLSPFQKFRWVHFPRNAEIPGDFVYRVKPVFMDAQDKLSYGEAQECPIQLARETYPGRLNVTFTRGFVTSQAFVDRYVSQGAIKTLLPPSADGGLEFKPTHPLAKEALAWMGFEARSAILEVLDEALADKKAEVRVVAYDLSEPEVVARLRKLGKRLKIIIDDDGSHKKPSSGESKAERMLQKSAGKANVMRQHMGKLQHNKTIVVQGPKAQAAVCGSTNFSWRGFYVQANNAMILRGSTAVQVFRDAFDAYWDNSNDPAGFGKTASAKWTDLKLANIDAQVAFCPLAAKNSQLDKIGADVANTKSSLLFSLAFLYQTKGAMQDAVKKLAKKSSIFCYGISDKKVGPLTEGIDFQKPDGTVKVVFPSELAGNVPEPFKSEPTGGGGTRMHHKFLVIDFDKPSARVYLGSYNFSKTADGKNGENLLLIRDRRVAVSYMIEALRIFDHHHFRIAQREAKKKRDKLQLAKPPRKASEKPWWLEDYTDARKIKDRELFS